MSTDAQPVDRFLITAVVDRLIFGDPDSFSAEDARTLLHALPRKRVPWFEIGAKGQVSGGSARGFAAGVGNVKVEDPNKRKFDVSTSQRRLYAGRPVEAAALRPPRRRACGDRASHGRPDGRRPRRAAALWARRHTVGAWTSAWCAMFAFCSPSSSCRCRAGGRGSIQRDTGGAADSADRDAGAGVNQAARGDRRLSPGPTSAAPSACSG